MDVAVSARVAVTTLGVVLSAVVAFGSVPLVAAGAVAALDEVANHGSRVVRAVGVGQASLVALGVGRELRVADGATATVVGVVVLDSTGVAGSCVPLVAAGAVASRIFAGNVGRVV